MATVCHCPSAAGTGTLATAPLPTSISQYRSLASVLDPSQTYGLAVDQLVSPAPRNSVVRSFPAGTSAYLTCTSRVKSRAGSMNVPSRTSASPWFVNAIADPGTRVSTTLSAHADGVAATPPNVTVLAPC